VFVSGVVGGDGGAYDAGCGALFFLLSVSLSLEDDDDDDVLWMIC